MNVRRKHSMLPMIVDLSVLISAAGEGVRSLTSVPWRRPAAAICAKDAVRLDGSRSHEPISRATRYHCLTSCFCYTYECNGHPLTGGVD